MRIKYSKLIAFIIVFVNIVLVFYALRLFNHYHKFVSGPTIIFQNVKPEALINYKYSQKNIGKLITVIIREFETHENDVSATVDSILKILPNAEIYILFDKVPYPPINIAASNVSSSKVRLMDLTPSLGRTALDSFSLFNINSKYVLFIPDATRLLSKQCIQILLNKAVKNKGAVFVSPVSRNKDLECYRLSVNIREWSLKYNMVKSSYCDAISGKHVILIETDSLRNLSSPFLLPFPSSLYIQTSALNIKVFIVKSGLFHEGRTPLRTHYAKWKFKQIVQDRFKRLYDLFKIKLVAREGRTEWYGCNRETPRCFEEVLDSMPSYLYENKWTPPCCLAHLRKTAKYILEVLDHAGIRYWLESGSLLGAVRSADVLPWDHKVDIGFINDDTNRCRWLQIAQNRSVIDNRGFFWEKILAGNLFRIYFSKYNKIFVNLIPFFHKNGTMSRDIFYDSYRNMEFSDNFLHPMSSIEFIGKNVPCPNNVRSFLELKFGKGCIEHPEYPNPIKMKFPEN
ncbi:hypothetical protein WA026_022819 [Henosepilachna vigintioctopunctata]|uniref:Fukutin-related protein n=1 Tax=Henosepilachna vigintioctopunctata TaxID=420089 RepID=A0AAW1VGJ2_9CUCU